MQNKEIERKFLVDMNKSGIELCDYPHLCIEQGYLNAHMPVVRVRKSNDEYYLTYKSGGVLAHDEYNLPLTKESYLNLVKKSDGKIITKKRYLIPYEKYTIELDVFEGAYEGLIFAEVEFESEEEANTFTPPSWFTEDVTYDRKYHNSYMATSC